jgi:adenosylhomocysteine nucleosidase
MSKIILVSASPFERYNETELQGIPIFEIGIGKTNSASKLTKIILEETPDVVVNFGSCGTLKKHPIGQVLKVGTVINDYETYGLGDEPRELIIDKQSNIKLFTTDHFYQPFENYSTWYNLNINKCDIVDMEGFALAKVCQDFGVEFHSYKWASDDGNPDHWLKNAAIGYNNFKTEFLQFFFGEY